MQNFTTTECNQMTNYNTSTGELMYTGAVGGSLTGKNTVKLTDSRNEQTYRIRKMQDGNCWMIDNLKIYNTTLYGADQGALHDSDIVSGAFTLPTTLSVGAANNDTSARVDDVENGAYTQHGSTYCGNGSGGMGTVENKFPNTTTGCGYLYNWYTATAGEGVPMFPTGVTTNSICPKNWGLPTGGAGGQFQTLNNVASLVAGGSSFQAPKTGATANPGFSSVGSYGYYWSASALTSGNATTYILMISDSSADPLARAYRLSGHAIRCVL